MKNKHNKKIGYIIIAAALWMVFVFYFGIHRFESGVLGDVSDSTQSLKENINKKLASYTSPYNEYIFQDGDTNETMISSEKTCEPFTCYSGDDFLAIYDSFEKNTELRYIEKPIYDDKNIDDYIRNIAESRGYEKRVLIESDILVNVDGVMVQPELAKAYIYMRDVMQEENLKLSLASGHRSFEKQRDLFLEKVGKIPALKIVSGEYDDQIEYALEKSALPGYSKHHSGFAADFGCGADLIVFGFGLTDCYSWLAKNNFENAKRFGFIPSYPDGISEQGPNPEPWEFVWVGVDNI